MKMKREDFSLVRSFEDKLFLALREDFFDGLEEDLEVEIPIPEPTEEELAEIEKEKKKAELLEQLKALE